MNAFPPDIIILTHAHWDHTQGVPFLRKKAAQQKKEIQVMASQESIPLLEDQSWNEGLAQGSLESIREIIPLKEGDTVDLGGLSLKIFDVPGHSKDHIAILDEKNKNLFIGDAIGAKNADHFFIPTFMPPYWNWDDFNKTVKKLKEIDYDSLCLAHFGYIYDDEAKNFVDDAVPMYELWWKLFEENKDRLDDTGYMQNLISKEANLIYPETQILNPKLKAFLGFMTGMKKISGKKPPLMSELILGQLIGMLVMGYRTSKGITS
jgi:glyoxylase-like metal-dependent hydrolase (beta-lactamase superfamily II)